MFHYRSSRQGSVEQFLTGCRRMQYAIGTLEQYFQKHLRPHNSTKKIQIRSKGKPIEKQHGIQKREYLPLAARSHEYARKKPIVRKKRKVLRDS